MDTLIGNWLPAWKLKPSTKQVHGSKFYFFDCGVARALSSRLPYPPTNEELGPLLETFILQELRAYLAYKSLHYSIYFWKNRYGKEVDFFLENKKGEFIGIEIKSSSRWDKKFNQGFVQLKNEMKKHKIKAYGVFLGKRSIQLDDVSVLPVTTFLKQLWADEII